MSLAIRVAPAKKPVSSHHPQAFAPPACRQARQPAHAHALQQASWTGSRVMMLAPPPKSGLATAMKTPSSPTTGETASAPSA